MLRKIEEEEKERLKLESDFAEMEKEEIDIIQIFKSENISEQKLIEMFEKEFNNKNKTSLETDVNNLNEINIYKMPYTKPKLFKSSVKTE